MSLNGDDGKGFERTRLRRGLRAMSTGASSDDCSDGGGWGLHAVVAEAASCDSVADLADGGILSRFFPVSILDWIRPEHCLHRPTPAPPPAACCTPLSEPDVGISRFASAVPGFRGALKQRYSDFVIQQVGLDGSLVRLTSFDLPDAECVDVKEGDMDEVQALE
ncbi:hypothetical protein E2562_037353 [Oryza meyeriana var. granulata]|uniref:Uncharacterized protein n=1 Tax=Oryza meyeriana var. granulata TaxID=110450 RepID=A0A6G1CCE0_9ORYZ|nr:hypothetical protein E2562_037353 [Oryza meyeriana var. granulata]